jgi:hypothetical protein
MPRVPAPVPDGIPAVLLEMQRRAESQFIALKTAEQATARLRGRRPEPFVRPARPGPVHRALMRLLPPLARRWQARALRDCGLFDAAWYLGTHADVKAAGADPVLHYLRFGAAEGRDPGPGFSTAHYLRLYPDVKAAGINPLIHYLTAGWEEKRSIHPLMPEGQP